MQETPQTTDQKFMETERIPKLLVRFAGPALAGMLCSALYNIVDRIFVGQTVGAPGLGAIALSFPCMLFFLSISFLVGMGAASRVSILMGEKRQKDAERTLGNATTMAVVLGVLCWILGRAFFRDILLLSGTSEKLYPVAASYLSIILYGIIFSIVSFSLSCQIRAMGSPAYAMGSQAVGAIANIVLDAWFVLGLDMGVEGAAIATVTSQFFSMLWAISYFFRKQAVLKLRVRNMLQLDRASLGRILAIGTPSCLVQLNLVLVLGMTTNAANSHGGDLAVSATGIFTSLDSLLVMPAIAIAEACQPIVGYNYGAGRIERVEQTVKTGIQATTVFCCLSFAMLMLFAEYMVLMFNSDDQALIALASRAVRVSNIGIPIMGISIINASFLQGLGKGREGLILAVIRFGIFLWIPLLLLPRYLGVYGAWGSFPISHICGSIADGYFMVYTMKQLRKTTTQKPLG